LQQAQEGQSEKFKKALNELIPELNKNIDELCAEAEDKSYTDASSMEPDKILDVLKNLDNKMDLFKQYDTTSERYNDWQVKLFVPQTNFDNLDNLRTQLVNRHLMWHSLADWNIMQADWMETQFGQIDAPLIQKISTDYAKICKRLEGALEANPIQAKLKENVDKFELAMPVVMALRNPDLKEHHWDDINELIGQKLDIHEEGFTLQNLIDMNVTQFNE